MNTHVVYIVFKNMEHYPSAIINYPPYLFLCNFSYQRLRISSDFNISLRTERAIVVTPVVRVPVPLHFVKVF